MSVFIGEARGPDHNSPAVAADVWCSPGQVELTVFGSTRVSISIDPVAARNYAALLVRGADEAERMRKEKP